MVSYDELALLVGQYPELLILHRFSPLAAQVLHRMQAGLLELQDDMNVLREVEAADEDTGGPTKSWAKVNEDVQAGRSDPRNNVLEQAHDKLREYYEFADLTSRMIKAPEPDACDLNFLQSWLQDTQGGDNFLKRYGAEGFAWSHKDKNEYFSLNQRPDRLAAWLGNNVVPQYYHEVRSRIRSPSKRNKFGPYEFWRVEDSRLVVLANVVTTVVSSVIPCLSIIVLYYVQSMLARLISIAVFGAVFSLIMSSVSQGRRYEVFAASTAFAAVQVVFVGGTDNANNAGRANR